MSKVIVIAEAGVNHNGSLDLAKQLVDKAVEAGADYVKFQTFKADNIASKFAVKADYQKKTTMTDENQLGMLKRLELSYDAHVQLKEYCSKKNIRFLSTPFDLDSINLLKELGINLGKIPSGEITNLPYLIKMAESFKNLIMSTGMATVEEIEDAIKVLTTKGMSKDKLILLHCNTEYPTPFKDVNLLAMRSMGERFGVKMGYSDHTEGIEVAIAATALGACLIEKHFTLDRNMEGPDHKASLEPAELKAMVNAIRRIEAALGDGKKKPSPSEIKNKTVARKSIVASRDICRGELLGEENLTVKRPGNGISPMKWNEVLGTAAVRDFQQDDLIEI